MVQGINNDQLREVDLYLREFEKLVDAFDISLQIANENDENVACYGCVVLKKKIKNYFYQLNEERQRSIINDIFFLCQKFINGINAAFL